ncbi:archaetidylserine decarboxylase [Marinospirillum alkaliphilum]|uniref:Phosphatidylserine decarboxylase proenzyme n=1 Tax=Marinospirillum alkaliphilum DSM 21637 TaxID=1122209 RepID=A0A1K1W923_9GAMM|nr:archaetidylserine decarboxylase [Marinospirillum alkaliphilum]SFX33872.1 phosphatidylserine decarboxylase [Marinospirillum alkaliphilum DSM 21637]
MNKARLFAWSQYLLPHHLLSRLTGALAECRIGWIKNLLIRKFVQRFQVDMSEALQEDLTAYANFNDFFTRELKPGMREIVADPLQLASPADGAISELGVLEHGQLLQAKGIRYSLTRLLGGDVERAKPFMGGSFATIYLSPRDYHRVHMPLDGRLLETIYVPGRLFSVNQATADNVPGLFARNERLVAFFETPAGPMALILVGAMIVAGIETVWDGQVAPPARKVTVKDFSDPQPVVLEKGEEMGRFKLGSTAIMVFGPEAVQWREDLQNGTPVRLGEALATLAATGGK